MKKFVQSGSVTNVHTKRSGDESEMDLEGPEVSLGRCFYPLAMLAALGGLAAPSSLGSVRAVNFPKLGRLCHAGIQPRWRRGAQAAQLCGVQGAVISAQTLAGRSQKRIE
jgi:hypothetical protein